jgi:hypothetical protein
MSSKTSAGIRWVALAALPGLVISATNQYLFMRAGHGTILESAMASASIDGIALISGWFAHRDTKSGRNAMIPRLGLYLAALASIYINLQHANALHSGERGLGVAFAAAASGSIYALELTLRAMRGDRKAATDRITARPAVMMPVGLLISAPLSTWRTHRMDVRARHAEFHAKIRQHVEGMVIPADEMAWVIGSKARGPVAAPGPESLTIAERHQVVLANAETASAKVRYAAQQLEQPDVSSVRDWLADRDHPVADQAIMTALRRMADKQRDTGPQPVLVAVNGSH